MGQKLWVLHLTPWKSFMSLRCQCASLTSFWEGVLFELQPHVQPLRRAQTALQALNLDGKSSKPSRMKIHSDGQQTWAFKCSNCHKPAKTPRPRKRNTKHVNSMHVMKSLNPEATRSSASSELSESPLNLQEPLHQALAN